MTGSPTVSVVIPALNEAANLTPLAERLFAAVDRAGLTCELVVVDDGSTDDTQQVLAALLAAHPGRVIAVRHERNLGIPDSWADGIEAARGEFVCLMDADLQNPPEQVVSLYRALGRSRADIAQGVRSQIEREKDSRLVFSRGLNLILNTAFRDRAADSKSGFLLGPRLVMADVVHHRGRYKHFQTFIRVAALAKGYTIVEVETLFLPRKAGTSFLAGRRTWQVTWEALTDIPRGVAEFGRGRRAPLDGTVAPRSHPVPPVPHPYSGWRRAWFEAYFATMPAHSWLIRRNARSIYLELKATERYPADDLRALQLRKLQRMVRHAYVHVPYYREAFDRAGVRPDDIQTLDDIRRLPLLSKDDVRDNLYFDLFSDTHRKRDMLKIATSGSTGEPFVTYADRFQLEVRFASTLRGMEWAGWRFGDRQARLWHQTLGMTPTQVIRERIDAAFMRRMFVPAFEMTPEKVREFVAQIREWDPVLVDGYAESLNFLARFVEEGGAPGFAPRAVMSSAQVLPDQVRDTIEREFGTRVFDKYGSREFSGIAYQCGLSRDHHVMDESYVVEIVVDGRPALPGEVGEVLVTDLNNYSVPLIRYRLGDLAEAVAQDPCPCGRAHSRIGAIQGRTQAIVICANGAWMPGTFFAHFFKEYDHLVRHFQVVQTQPGALTLRVVPGDFWSADSVGAMLADLRQYVGDTTIEVDQVDEVPLQRTGKRSPVVSMVQFEARTNRPVLRPTEKHSCGGST